MGGKGVECEDGNPPDLVLTLVLHFSYSLRKDCQDNAIQVAIDGRESLLFESGPRRVTSHFSPRCHMVPRISLGKLGLALAFLLALHGDASAQLGMPPQVVASFSAAPTTSGNAAPMGNWITPNGTFSLTPIGGAMCVFNSIDVTLEQQVAGNWVLVPNSARVAVTNGNTWSTGSYTQLPGATTYRVKAVMNYGVIFPPNMVPIPTTYTDTKIVTFP